MSRKNISQEKIIEAFLATSFDRSAGATSLADVADYLEIKKASLYNHFENRDAMYDATLDYAEREINSINFLADKALDSIKNGKITITTLFKKLIARYFNLYETEPTFQVYVFIHAEQYFNLKAFDIVRTHYEKITDEIRRLLLAFMAEGKLEEKGDKETREIASYISSMILQQLDLCIANRKEIVRQNPESGAGSLFELPSDDSAVNRTVKMLENYLSVYARVRS